MLVDTSSASGITKSQKGIRVANNTQTHTKKKKGGIALSKESDGMHQCLRGSRSQFATGIAHAVIDRRAGLFGRVPPLLATAFSWPPLLSTIVMFLSRCLNGRTRRLREPSVVRVMS